MEKMREKEGRRGREMRGRDAADMTPRFIPDDELLPRDDSGGHGFDPYTQEWGDGGRVTGDKAHLSVRGGKSDEKTGDELTRDRGGRGERGRSARD